MEESLSRNIEYIKALMDFNLKSVADCQSFEFEVLEDMKIALLANNQTVRSLLELNDKIIKAME